MGGPLFHREELANNSSSFTMSKSQSGLGRLKRDWSNASITSASCSSEAVDWDPTPPKKQQVEADEKLEKANKRLLVIKQALASMEPNKPVQSSAPVSRPLGQSLAVNNPNGKRPSLGSADATIPTKKPRQLPPSWRDDPLSTSSISRKSSSSTVKSTSSNRPSTASTTGNAGDSKSYTVPAPSSSGGSSKQNKMPKLFLSQEQTHILKLVEGGSSVFYTGSAGGSIPWTVTIPRATTHSWFWFQRYGEVGASTRNH